MTLHVAVVNRHPSDALGGSELQCDLFARGLAERGHRITYVALHSDVLGKDRLLAPYQTVCIPPETSREPQVIADTILAAGADVVYWRYGRQHLDGVVARLARDARALPLVFAVAHIDDVSRWPARPPTRGGVRDHGADLLERVAHRRSWRAFRNVAAIAAQREDFLGRVPVAIQRHIPNVVDPTIALFPWPRPYVAWVASIKARKRPEQLAPLAHALAEHGIDLLVAGRVSDDRYDSLATYDSAVPNLHPLGPLPPAEAAGLIAGARCLAVTFRPEGLSNVVIQAWWHGVPTVSFDYDPDGAIVQHGLGALAAGDAEAFRASVILHATEAAPREEAGRAARIYAQERFGWERNVERLESLLSDVARSRTAD